VVIAPRQSGARKISRQTGSGCFLFIEALGSFAL